MPACPKPIKIPKKRKRLRAIGEKGTNWQKTREILKSRFEQAGITKCELGYRGCWRNNALSFAHSKKRRYIESQEELEQCIVCCTPCHQKIEFSSDMYETVLGVIAARKVVV